MLSCETRPTRLGLGQFSAIQAGRARLGVQVSPIDVRDSGEIERAIAALARLPNNGLVVTGSASITGYRNLIIGLAAKHKIAAVYPNRLSVIDQPFYLRRARTELDLFRRAAGYVDRVLNGEKLAELPVQAPTKFELIINQKLANALDLAIPAKLLASADEVIE